MADPRRQPAPAGAGATSVRHPAILEESGLGPWRGRVRVIPIGGFASRWGEMQFEVRVEWTGPGLPGLPPVDRPVEAADTYLTADRELAKALAGAATEDLRRPAVPDLREQARRLSRHD